MVEYVAEPDGILSFNVLDKPVLTIHQDGTLEVGAGYTPTEAGNIVIDAIRDAFPAVFQQCRAHEREKVARWMEGQGQPGYAAEIRNMK